MLFPSDLAENFQYYLKMFAYANIVTIIVTIIRASIAIDMDLELYATFEVLLCIGYITMECIVIHMLRTSNMNPNYMMICMGCLCAPIVLLFTYPIAIKDCLHDWVDTRTFPWTCRDYAATGLFTSWHLTALAMSVSIGFGIFSDHAGKANLELKRVMIIQKCVNIIPLGLVYLMVQVMAYEYTYIPSLVFLACTVIPYAKLFAPKARIRYLLIATQMIVLSIILSLVIRTFGETAVHFIIERLAAPFAMNIFLMPSMILLSMLTFQSIIDTGRRQSSEEHVMLQTV
jgi:hypothetical protein